MASKFTDIKILSLDDAASGPSGQGALLRVVLRLSQSAPVQWSQYFNQAWDQNLYMMKRRAHVAGDRLEIICVPDELERDHLPQLNKVIAETNQAYRGYIEKQAQIEEAEAQRTRMQREELSKLKDRLKL